MIETWYRVYQYSYTPKTEDAKENGWTGSKLNCANIDTVIEFIANNIEKRTKHIRITVELTEK
jgi:hypothetical protein